MKSDTCMRHFEAWGLPQTHPFERLDMRDGLAYKHRAPSIVIIEAAC